MSYDTFSSSAPTNNTGAVSFGAIRTVPNNPGHPDASDSNYPTYYDQFVNKTEGRSDQPILVTAEKHDSSELIYQSSLYYLYLHHSPAELGAASISSSDGVINTGAIDYTLGLICFTTAPTGTFYVNYYARTDAFYAEHINALQNSIMSIQRVLGAGTLTGEGVRNAKLLVTDLPTSASAHMPNAVEVDELTGNLTIKGAESTAVTITLGNGSDIVKVDCQQFKVTSTDLASLSGQIGDTQDDVLKINASVWLAATGGTGTVGLTPTGYFGNAGVVIGNPYQSTASGWASTPGPYNTPFPSGLYPPIARIFGDLQIIGNVFISGVTAVAASVTGTQVSTINESLQIGIDLSVSGNSQLGNDTLDRTNVSGPLTVGRYMDIQGLSNDISRINTQVYVKNQGNINNGYNGPYDDTVVSRGTKWQPDLPFHVGSIERSAPASINDMSINKVVHFDGLDASYIAKSLIYRAHDRSDFKNNCVNIGPYEGITGSATTVTAPGTSQWRDTGLEWPSTALSGFEATTGFTGAVNNVGRQPFRWHHAGGDYYEGKFSKSAVVVPTGEFSGDYQYGDAEQWNVLWLQNDLANNINYGAMKYGARVPLQNMTIAYHTGSPWFATGVTIQLSRAFNTTINSGDAYSIYHPMNSKPNALRYSSATVIQAYASIAEPIVCTVNGIKKILTSPCTDTITSNYTGMHYVFLSCRTPEIAKIYNGYILESEPTIVLKTHPVPDETEVPLGEFYSSDPGAGIDTSTIVTYRYNTKYDTLWFRTQAEENLQSANTGETMYRADVKGLTTNNTGTIELPAPYVYGTNLGDVLVKNEEEYRVRIRHNFGSVDRARKANLKVYVAPNQYTGYTGSYNSLMTFREGPDYAYIRQLENVKYNLDGAAATTYPCYEILHVDRNYTDITLYEAASIPGAIIGARDTGNNRNLVLTGSAGITNLTGAGIDERERKWWWTRVVID